MIHSVTGNLPDTEIMTMGMYNHCSIAEQVMGNYQLGTMGGLHATYESMVNADLPSYAHGFYAPSQHERFSDIMYSRAGMDYEQGMEEIRSAIAGFHGQGSHSLVPVDDTGSAVPKTWLQQGLGAEVPEVVEAPTDDAVEIIKAQEQARKKLLVESYEYEEVIIKRKISKTAISVQEE